MEKFSPAALRILKSYGSNGLNDVDEFAKHLVIAYAQNSGLAGLLPAAVVELAINTAIAYHNAAAELGKQYFSNQNQ